MVVWFVEADWGRFPCDFDEIEVRVDVDRDVFSF
jgi:hypothetical protein